MKKFTLTTLAIIFLGLTAQAQIQFGTADNVNYNIIVKDNYSFKSCATQIQKISKKQGNGYFKALTNVGIVIANLTSKAAQEVSELNCVMAIEVDGIVNVIDEETEFRTQDNVNYIIAVKEDSDFYACADSIYEISKNQGNGAFATLEVIGVVTTNLTTKAAHAVSQLECVIAIEEEKIVYPSPRVGRGN